MASCLFKLAGIRFNLFSVHKISSGISELLHHKINHFIKKRLQFYRNSGNFKFGLFSIIFVGYKAAKNKFVLPDILLIKVNRFRQLFAFFAK